MNRERKTFKLTSGETGSIWLVYYDSLICNFKLCNELNADDNEYNMCSTHDYYLKYHTTHVVLSLKPTESLTSISKQLF